MTATPELSRRVATALQHAAEAGQALPIIERLALARAAEKAETWERLPRRWQEQVIEMEQLPPA